MFKYKFQITLEDLSFSDHKYFLINLIDNTKSQLTISKNVIDKKYILNYDSINIEELQTTLKITLLLI